MHTHIRTTARRKPPPHHTTAASTPAPCCVVLRPPYPFFQNPTLPMLFSQISTGLPLHHWCPTTKQFSCPTSPNAKSFPLSFFPSSALPPQFVYLELAPEPTTPYSLPLCPTPLTDPLVAFAQHSLVHAGNLLVGCGILDNPS